MVSPPKRWQLAETVYGHKQVSPSPSPVPLVQQSSLMKPVPLYGEVHQKEMQNDGSSVV